METNILIITGQGELRQLLEQALVDIVSDQLHFAETDESALLLANAHPPGVVLLDAESTANASNLALELLKKFPESRLILVPPANDPQHFSIRDLTPDKYLGLPFIKEDLLQMIDDLSVTSITAPENLEKGRPSEETFDLLDDLKEQLDSNFDEFPQIEEGETLSLEDELDQVLSQNYSSREEFDAGGFQHDSRKPDPEGAWDELAGDDEPSSLEDTVIEQAGEPEQGEIEDSGPELDTQVNEIKEPAPPEVFDSFPAETEVNERSTAGPQTEETGKEAFEPPLILEEQMETEEKDPQLHEKPAESQAEKSASSQPNFIQALQKALLEEDLPKINEILKSIGSQNDMLAVLLFNQGRILTHGDALDEADREEIEPILTQATWGERSIDIARFLKLGENKEKYLLYAVSILNAFGICTINPTTRPLSEIRSQTLQMAQQLQIDEQRIERFIADTTEKLPPPASSGEPSEPEESIEVTEEAPQTTLDDILSKEAFQEESGSIEEADEWVYEMSEEAEAPGDLGQEGVPSLDGGASVEGDTDRIVLKSAEDAGQEPAEAYQATPAEEIAAEAASSTLLYVLPKVGQGRFKVKKPGWEKDISKTVEQALQQNMLERLFKPNVRLYEKTHLEEGRIREKSPLVKSFPAWRPSADDPLIQVRPRLKNQKAPIRVKDWKLDDEETPHYLKQEPSIKEDIHAQPLMPALDEEAEISAEIDLLETESQETGGLSETPPAPVIPQETIEVSKAPGEELESREEEQEQKLEDWISPPETLEETGLEDRALPDLSAPENQDGLDEILSEIMVALDDGEPRSASSTLEETAHTDRSEPGIDEEDLTTTDLDAEDEVIIMEENLDLLKELADGMRFDGFEEDEDADAFFEEYMIRAGERIEEQEPADAEKRSATTGEESAVKDFEAEEAFSDAAVEEAEEPIETEESGEEITAPEDEFTALKEAEPSDYTKTLQEKLAGTSEPEVDSLKAPGIDEEFSPTIIPAQDAAEDEADTERVGISAEREQPAELEEDEMDWEEFPAYLEELDKEEKQGILQVSSEEELTTIDWEEIEAAGTSDEQITLVETDQAVEEIEATDQDEAEFNKILTEVLSDEEDELPADIQTLEDQPPVPEKVDLKEELLLDERFEEIEDIGFEPGHAATLTKDEEEDILAADLLPWEEEGDLPEDDIEITPTPSSLLDEDQSADLLVDLLADTRLDDVSLNFDQPLYTCILVPELTEFTLNNKIANRIKEWLPRLSRVFGWQFVNVLVQPTYLQWTVRVPSGTSQGSIVRKVRQQTSLRIFEEFPELKELSLSGNFWAKGYLVVSGGNPPPAEFLDDFIQKNRRPKGIFGD